MGRLRGRYPVRYVEHEDGEAIAHVYDRDTSKKKLIHGGFPFLWPRAVPFVPWEHHPLLPLRRTVLDHSRWGYYSLLIPTPEETMVSDISDEYRVRIGGSTLE